MTPPPRLMVKCFTLGALSRDKTDQVLGVAHMESELRPESLRLTQSQGVLIEINFVFMTSYDTSRP